MSRAVSVLTILFVTAILAVLPGGKTLLSPQLVYAASGATFIAPPNYYFEAEPKHVGDGPTNYDFSDGATGWTKTGTVTFSGGVATLSGSATLRSSSYTLADDVQSIKVRYKAGATASVSVLMGGSGVGSGDLSCIGCTTGEWVEKYIPVYTVAQGEDVKVRFFQTSGTTEIDWAGTQWIRWSAPWDSSTTHPATSSR